VRDLIQPLCYYISFSKAPEGWSWWTPRPHIQKLVKQTTRRIQHPKKSNDGQRTGQQKGEKWWLTLNEGWKNQLGICAKTRRQKGLLYPLKNSAIPDSATIHSQRTIFPVNHHFSPSLLAGSLSIVWLLRVLSNLIDTFYAYSWFVLRDFFDNGVNDQRGCDLLPADSLASSRDISN
jgi:hypothetical protein